MFPDQLPVIIARVLYLCDKYASVFVVFFVKVSQYFVNNDTICKYTSYCDVSYLRSLM